MKNTKKEVFNLLNYFQKKFKEQGITKEDIEKEITAEKNEIFKTN